jgi:hypothetical protein
MLFTQINSTPFFPAFLEWNKIWSKTAGKLWCREPPTAVTCRCGAAPREASPTNTTVTQANARARSDSEAGPRAG